MGIKSINALLKEKAAQAFAVVPVSVFRGYRVGIDGCNYVYQVMSSGNRDVILSMVDPLEEVDRNQVVQLAKQSMIQFTDTMSTFGITLVWLWDGKPLADKASCRDERKAAKDATMARIVAGRQLLESIHPLARSAEDTKEYKKLLCQLNPVSGEEMKHFRQMVELLGYPSLQALNEGEKLASNLAAEGLIAGVWSTDTDNYVLGTPITITGFAGVDKDRNPLVSIVQLPVILASIGQTHQWLIDLCIMCGCDFNSNMPNVGPKRSWDLMVKYGSIENVVIYETTKPTAILNHVRCREIFARVSTGYVHTSPELNFNRQQFCTFSRDVVNQYNLSHQYESLLASTSRLTSPMCVEFVKKPSRLQIGTSEPPVVKTSRLAITREAVEEPVVPPLTALPAAAQ